MGIAWTLAISGDHVIVTGVPCADCSEIILNDSHMGLGLKLGRCTRVSVLALSQGLSAGLGLRVKA